MATNKYIEEQLTILEEALANPPDSSAELDAFHKRMDTAEQPEVMTDEEIGALALDGQGVKDAEKIRP